MSLAVKHGKNTPKGTPPLPTRLATKRKRLWWWAEHEVKSKARKAAKLAARAARAKALADAKVKAAHAEDEAKRKARRQGAW